MSLARIASALVDLRPPVRHADPGTVLLVFRNGRAHCVFETGKKPRRLRGLPMTGGLQGMNLSTEEIPVTVPVHDIRLEGAFPLLRRVDINLRISLNRNDEYSGLLRYVERKGINFHELVERDLQSEVEGRVRQALGPYTAEEIDALRAGAASDGVERRLTFDDSPLVDGLFSISHFDYPTVEHHPGYIEARDVRIARAVEDVRIEEDLAQASLRLQQSLGEAAIETAKARARGLTLHEYENPELVAADRAHAAALELARVEQDSTRELAEVQGRTEIAAKFVEQFDELRREGLLREALGTLGQHLNPGQSASATTPHRPSDNPVVAEHVIGAPAPAVAPPDLDLRTDPGLLGIWSKNAQGLRAEGLGFGGDTVLAVSSALVPEDVVLAIAEAYRAEAGIREVFVVDEVRNVEDLIMRFLKMRFEDLASGLQRVDVQSSITGITLVLSSDDMRLSPLIRELNDPSALGLEALARVLPQRVAHVRGAVDP